MQGRPPPVETDDELIALARAGDDRAFSVLVQRHSEVAFRAAYLILGDADAASDAAQEGFISVYRALHRFRQGDPFRPWLLRIVGNRARNLRRAAGRRAAATARLELAPQRVHAASAEETASAAERQAEVIAAVNALAPEDRAVLSCRYFLDLAEAETAELLGLRPGTVKSRLSRARGRLRRVLQQGAGDG